MASSFSYHHHRVCRKSSQLYHIYTYLQNYTTFRDFKCHHPGPCRIISCSDDFKNLPTGILVLPLLPYNVFSTQQPGRPCYKLNHIVSRPRCSPYGSRTYHSQHPQVLITTYKAPLSGHFLTSCPFLALLLSAPAYRSPSCSTNMADTCLFALL